MILKNIKKEVSPKKKQDLKMLIIAVVALLLMIVVLIWLFSGSSKEENVVQNIQISTNNTQSQKSEARPKPPALNQQAISEIYGEDSEQVKSGIGENPFETSTSNENIENSAKEIDSRLNQDAINSLVEESDKFVPPASIQNIASTQENNANSINKADENMVFGSHNDMKNYLNEIKKDIKLASGSFEYKNKIYKKGDTLNSINIIDVSDMFIRFSNGDWEYTLRFVGDK